MTLTRQRHLKTPQKLQENSKSARRVHNSRWKQLKPQKISRFCRKFTRYMQTSLQSPQKAAGNSELTGITNYNLQRANGQPPVPQKMPASTGSSCNSDGNHYRRRRRQKIKHHKSAGTHRKTPQQPSAIAKTTVNDQASPVNEQKLPEKAMRAHNEATDNQHHRWPLHNSQLPRTDLKQHGFKNYWLRYQKKKPIPKITKSHRNLHQQQDQLRFFFPQSLTTNNSYRASRRHYPCGHSAHTGGAATSGRLTNKKMWVSTK